MYCLRPNTPHPHTRLNSCMRMYILYVEDDYSEGYLGCWEDESESDLDYFAISHRDITITNCLDICYKLSYQYAGVQVRSFNLVSQNFVTMLLQKCSYPWGWVSGKVHSEHIVATKVLMPMGGGVSRKVHSEHIGRFRAGGKQSRFELPSCNFHDLTKLWEMRPQFYWPCVVNLNKRTVYLPVVDPGAKLFYNVRRP